MRSECFHLILFLGVLSTVSCQNTAATPLVLQVFQDDPAVHVADVLRIDEESVAEDDARTADYDDQDGEVNRIHIPIDPIVGEDDATYEKTHHKPDHRFKLISLDNIVHLNPALQVSLWLFIACLVKVGMCVSLYFYPPLGSSVRLYISELDSFSFVSTDSLLR